MFPPELIERAAALIQLYREHGLKIVTAESCTGGLLAGLLTEIPGSSAVLERGFVVYSNEAKQEMLGVSEETLAKFGAVSAETVREMAHGAIEHSNAHVSLAITGIAGPDGGTAEKPVGLVYVGCGGRQRIEPISSEDFGGMTIAHARFGPRSRSEIRIEAIKAALTLLETAGQV